MFLVNPAISTLQLIDIFTLFFSQKITFHKTMQYTVLLLAI